MLFRSTLDVAADVANFEAGMFIVFYNADSFAASYRNATSGATSLSFTNADMVREVESVSRDINAGTATVTLGGSTYSNTATLTVGDIIVRDGDGIVGVHDRLEQGDGPREENQEAPHHRLLRNLVPALQRAGRDRLRDEGIFGEQE